MPVYADIPVFVLRVRDFLPASFDDWVLGDAGRMDSKKALRSRCLTNVTFRHHFNTESVVMSNLLALLDAWHHTSFYATQYDDLLYKRNETSVFLDVKTGVSFSAVLKEVNHLGQVCLELANGERVVYHHGQVRMNYVNTSRN